MQALHHNDRIKERRTSDIEIHCLLKRGRAHVLAQF